MCMLGRLSLLGALSLVMLFAAPTRAAPLKPGLSTIRIYNPHTGKISSVVGRLVRTSGKLQRRHPLWPGAWIPKRLPHGLGATGRLPARLPHGLGRTGQLPRRLPHGLGEAGNLPARLPHGLGPTGNLPRQLRVQTPGL